LWRTLPMPFLLMKDFSREMVPHDYLDGFDSDDQEADTLSLLSPESSRHPHVSICVRIQNLHLRTNARHRSPGRARHSHL
jgi:hypothetical protein